MPGTLFVVATPIGNLEDLTFRALRTLKEVDVIAAEDTRRTSKLLAHYQVSRPLVSLHEHNEYREAPKLVRRLTAGESVALVSDAGTPGISDPGSELVRQAHAAGVQVVPVPGPSAVTTALSVSGLALPRFTFLGFPPSAGAARHRWFETLQDEPGVLVFFESPHRLGDALTRLASCVNRPIHVHSELTKINERLVIRNNDNHGVKSSELGEHVVVVGPAPNAAGADGETVSPAKAAEIFEYLTNNAGIEAGSAQDGIAVMLSIPRSRLPNILKKGAISRKRQLSD